MRPGFVPVVVVKQKPPARARIGSRARSGVGKAPPARPPSYYRTPLDPSWNRTAAGKVLAIDGDGRPGGREFSGKLRALYGVGYTLRFDAKARGAEFRVAPLEGVWKPRRSDGKRGRSRWSWTLRLPVPRRVTVAHVAAARRKLERQRSAPWADQVALRNDPGGRCVQLLHVGPYSAEGADLARMRAFASEHGRTTEKGHVEIYLSDPRRVPPGSLRTLLRCGVGPAPERAAPRSTRT